MFSQIFHGFDGFSCGFEVFETKSKVGSLESLREDFSISPRRDRSISCLEEVSEDPELPFLIFEGFMAVSLVVCMSRFR